MDASSSSDNVILAVNWHYNQTGPESLLITSFELTLITVNGEERSKVLARHQEVPQKSDIGKMSVNFTISKENLQAGTYVVNVTATNTQGSSSVTCPSTVLRKSSLLSFAKFMIANFF